MQQTLKEFLSGILDYAGIFPPAKLPLDKALAEFSNYQHHRCSFIVPRFVISAERLPEVTAWLDIHRANKQSAPWHFSVLMKQPKELDAQKDSELQKELLLLKQFFEKNPEGSVHVDSFEVAVPATLAQNSDKIPDSLTSIYNALQSVCKAPVFFELPWKESFAPFVKQLQKMRRDSLDAAAKLRTGGLTQDAVPPSERVAEFLSTVATERVPFKATAGLHQPLRHTEASGLTLHGFMNVFTAAGFCFFTDSSKEKIIKILDEEKASAFQFHENGLRYETVTLALHDIKNLRTNYAMSFGSCSFLEPLEYLEKLGFAEHSELN